MVVGMRETIAELNERQQLSRAIVDFPARPAAQMKGQADVFQAG